MKSLIRPAMLLAAVGALALSPVIQVNADPTPQPRGEVTFTLAFEAPPPTPTGTIQGSFAVEGAIKDAGKASETYSVMPLDETFQELAVTGFKVLQGKSGTILMWFQARLHEGGLYGEAQYQIIGGTGAYKKIRGSGEGPVMIAISEDGTPYLAAVYKGSIEKDPSLK